LTNLCVDSGQDRIDKPVRLRCKVIGLTNLCVDSGHSANVNHTVMRAVYPYVHTLIKSKLTTSCTTASVERAVYQSGGVINVLAKSLRRRTI